jgi:hypothetical protein
MKRALGTAIYVPAGTYKIDGPLDTFRAGGLIGDVGNGLPVLQFSGCKDAAITIRRGPTGKRVVFENLVIIAESDCAGHGFDHDHTITLRKVAISGFEKSNIWTHASDAGDTSAPYMTWAENVTSMNSAAHGWLVGLGADNVTIVNYTGQHNGNGRDGGSGFRVDDKTEGKQIFGPVPEALTIIGGDCSYNAHYGWYIAAVAESHLQLGYAEQNGMKEIRVGDGVRMTVVQITEMYRGLDGFLDDMKYAPYMFNSKVLYGGKQIAPRDVFDLAANPTANDIDASDHFINAPTRRQVLSRSNDRAVSTSLNCNTTPDGTAVDVAKEAVVNLSGAGMYSVGIGSGSHHLKIKDNYVRLPQVTYHANSLGWNAPVKRSGSQ